MYLGPHVSHILTLEPRDILYSYMDFGIEFVGAAQAAGFRGSGFTVKDTEVEGNRAYPNSFSLIRFPVCSVEFDSGPGFRFFSRGWEYFWRWSYVRLRVAIWLW